MKILLDHCVDWRLARSLDPYDVGTAQQLGWSHLKNGELIAAAASAAFNVLVTTDRNLKHQQNIRSMPLGVIVLVAGSNRLAALEALLDELRRALSRIGAGEIIEIGRRGPA